MDLCSIDGQTTNIREMATNGTLCLCDPLDRHSSVSAYGAVQSSTGLLINKGDFVAYYSTEKKVHKWADSYQALNLLINDWQIEYGFLRGCCKSGVDSFCVIQQLHQVECVGRPITNEQNCPLFELGRHSHLIVASAIRSAVSFVHECSSDCILEMATSTVTVEREIVDTHCLRYKHHYDNRFFCLNIYCINSVCCTQWHIMHHLLSSYSASLTQSLHNVMLYHRS